MVVLHLIIKGEGFALVSAKQGEGIVRALPEGVPSAAWRMRWHHAAVL